MSRRFQPDWSYKVFLELLVQTRTDKEVTQEQLATRLEISTEQVAAIEAGERQLNFVQTREWCLALGVAFLDFMIDLDADLATAELLNGDDQTDANEPDGTESDATEGGAK